MHRARRGVVGVAQRPLVERRRVVEAQPEPVWSSAAKWGNLGGVWLKGHGYLVGYEVLGLSSRVPRAAPRLPMQPGEPPVAMQLPKVWPHHTTTARPLTVTVPHEQLHLYLELEQPLGALALLRQRALQLHRLADARAQRRRRLREPQQLAAPLGVVGAAVGGGAVGDRRSVGRHATHKLRPPQRSARCAALPGRAPIHMAWQRRVVPRRAAAFRNVAECLRGAPGQGQDHINLIACVRNLSRTLLPAWRTHSDTPS